jgi:hypothetical protein
VPTTKTWDLYSLWERKVFINAVYTLRRTYQWLLQLKLAAILLQLQLAEDEVKEAEEDVQRAEEEVHLQTEAPATAKVDRMTAEVDAVGVEATGERMREATL